jgi:hypothetical protein
MIAIRAAIAGFLLGAGLAAAPAPSAAGLAGREEDAARRATLQALDGAWSSPAPEPWYGAWGKREFTFQNGQWTLRFTFALDPEMTRPVFIFRTGGPYSVGARSAAAPAAFETVFFEDSKHLTLMTEDARLATAMGLAPCGLSVGVEADISERGCARWKPVKDCREDHDLLGMDASGGLLFGVRPRDNDMCTADRRPTQLLTPVVRR